jgi:hypothetical protein
MNGNHIKASVARGAALLLVDALAPLMRAQAQEAPPWTLEMDLQVLHV